MCQIFKAREGYHLKHGERYLNVNSEVFCIVAYISTSADETVLKEAYESLWVSHKKTLQERVKEAENHYKVKIEISKQSDGNSRGAKKVCLTISAKNSEKA